MSVGSTGHPGKAILIAGTWVVTATRGGVRGGDGGLGADRASLAVLPLTNLSGDPEHQYFGDGLAEELLNELARLDGLKVAARTSSFAFRDSAVDVPGITEALGVATVLEGSFRSGGDRILVNIQLVAADGFQLWSEEYERPMADVFDIQDEIAREIAREHGGRLLADEAALLDGGGTTSVQAHESYLRGLYAVGQRTGVSRARAGASWTGSPPTACWHTGSTCPSRESDTRCASAALIGGCR